MMASPGIVQRQAAASRGIRRRIALIASLLLLATCVPSSESELRFAGAGAPSLPPAPAVTSPRFIATEFIAEDGARLPLRKWLPTGPVKAVILALHGFNDYSKAFETPAKLWAARGIATYAYDQRGFGRAPDRGFWAGEGRLAVDAITATRILRLLYPGRPVYLLGESMGGGIAVLAMTGAMSGVIPGADGLPKAAADGVILSAPAVWGRSTMELLPKLALFAAARFIPETTLTGQGLKVLASDNLPMLRALARDPMVLKGARVATIYGLVNLMDDSLAAAPQLGMPLLLMYGAHDQVVPRVAMAEFAAHLPAAGAPKRLAFYPQGYHLLMRDLDGATVAEDVASWALDPAAQLPSHADALESQIPWPPDTKPPLGAAAMPLAPGTSVGLMTGR